MRFTLSILALLLALAPNAARPAVSNADGALQLGSCTEGKSKVLAECGSLRVYENRVTKSGRTIRIHFILLKATHPNGQVVYVNLGGPGEELAEVPPIADGAFLKELQPLRDRFDILFVDERGFGKSHPIACDLAPAAHPELYFAQLWPDQLLRACRAQDAKTSDLAQYNTPNAVDDLDDIRAALGYKTLSFDGGSYGTFTAFVYMRRHPSNVGSAVLMSVDPPGIANLTREFANGAQAAFDRLDSDCRRDTVCHRHFPQFRAHFYALLRRMDAAPLPVQFADPATKQTRTVGLSREVFSDAVRHALYDPEGASFLPLVIERAYHGDTRPLGLMVDGITQSFAQMITEGAFLSYTCAEDIPFGNSVADGARARATSWFRDDRIRAQQHACSIWNVPPLPSSFNEPVRSAAPILMISGTDDPATPSYEATQELRYLSDARQMLIKGAPHDSESVCTDDISERFIRSGGSFAGLDLNACSASFKRPPFATSLP